MGGERLDDYPILYALDGEGALRFVDDVANGEACGCLCPSCSQALIAKNGGSKVMHHFAHKRGTCAWSVENVVVRLATRCLEAYGRVTLPALSYHDHDRDEEVEISCARTLRVKAARTEGLSGRKAPEVVVTCTSKVGDREFALVWPLVHRITDSEVERLAESCPGVVVIDLAKDMRRERRLLGKHHDRAQLVMRYQDPSFIASVLLDTRGDLKSWLANALAERREQESLERYEARRAREEEQRWAAEELRRREELLEAKAAEERHRREAELAALERAQRDKAVIDRLQTITLIGPDGRSTQEQTTIREAVGRRSHQVIDASGRRWLECERCAQIMEEGRFWTYGGIGRMTLGSCYGCRDSARRASSGA